MSGRPRPRYRLAVACGLAASVLATTADAGPSDDLAQKVWLTVSTCVSGSAPAPSADSTAPTQPPLHGLGRDGADLKVTRLPTSIGRLYAYHSEHGAELVCGVALYGTSSSGAYQGVLDQLQASSTFSPARLTAYALSTPSAASSSYFGDPKAPALRGVLVLQRPEGGDSPTLQVDYHRTLVQ